MSRALRIEFPGAIYHVMARGVARTNIFIDDEDRRHFLTLVGEQVESGVFIVHAFCLMPNHSHKLCETPFGGLSRCMHDVLGSYAQAFNRRHNRVGHLFQDRFKALLVQDGDYLVECSRYIHLNPDGHESTRPMETYPWSSYQNYAGGPTVVDWVTTSKVLSYFNGVQEYLDYLQAGRQSEITDPFKEAYAGCIWGDNDFVKKMRAFVVKTGGPESDVPARRLIERWGTDPDFRTVRDITRQMFSLPEGRNPLIAYALWRFTWMKGVEIAEALGCTPGAVSQSVRRVEGRVRKDGALRAAFENIEGQLRLLADDAGLPGPQRAHACDWYRREGQAARRLRRQRREKKVGLS